MTQTEVPGLGVTKKGTHVTERCLAHVTSTTADVPAVITVAAVLRHPDLQVEDLGQS